MRTTLKTALLAVLFLTAPACASAALLITEVMYDLEGTDTGREWIEVRNDASSGVDLSGYKLYEANTNHGLTHVAGSAILSTGGYAVIADDASKFLADWPTYSGSLFESSFSLSNTGESLSIRTSDLVDEDTVSYSSDMGAGGDGKSLARSGSGFAATPPTPGAANGSSTGAQQPPSSTSGDGASPPPLAPQVGAELSKARADAHGDRTVYVGAGTFFTGDADGGDGKPLLNARYVWNFGDGEVAEGRRVFHTYRYPGAYVLFLTVSSGEVSASDRARIEAIPAQVGIRQETDGSLSVFNKGVEELDLSFWFLSRGGANFLIPKNTFVFPGEGLRFSPRILNLPLDQHATLLYPNGEFAANTEPLGGEDYIERGFIERIPAAPTAAVSRATSHVASVRSAASPAVLGTTSGFAGLSLGEEFSPRQPEPDEAGRDPLFWWLLLLGLLMAIGIGAVVLIERRRIDPIEAEAAQYEIIVEKDN